MGDALSASGVHRLTDAAKVPGKQMRAWARLLLQMAFGLEDQPARAEQL